MRTHLVVVVVFVLASSLSITALAEDRAREAFERGSTLYDQQRFAEAAAEFRLAHKLRPSWKILFNIAQCSAAAKQYGLALEAFEAYLSLGGDEVPIDKRDTVVSEMKVIREMVGYLVIEAPPESEIYVDSLHRGVTPLPGPVAAAAGVNHHLSISHNSEIILQKTFRVNSGITLTINAKGDSEKSNSPAETDEKETAIASTQTVDSSPLDTQKIKAKTPKKHRILRLAGWSSLGVGLGLIGGGVATGMMVLSLHDDIEAQDCADPSCSEESVQMKDLQTPTNILFAVGGTVVVTGITLLLVSYIVGRKSKKEVAVTPTLSPGLYGISLTQSF